MRFSRTCPMNSFNRGIRAYLSEHVFQRNAPLPCAAPVLCRVATMRLHERVRQELINANDIPGTYTEYTDGIAATWRFYRIPLFLLIATSPYNMPMWSKFSTQGIIYFSLFGTLEVFWGTIPLKHILCIFTRMDHSELTSHSIYTS